LGIRWAALLNEPEGSSRPAVNCGFCSMKRIVPSLLPFGWEASPSQGYLHPHPPRPPAFLLGGPNFIHLVRKDNIGESSPV